jgi:hypothetical protein
VGAREAGWLYREAVRRQRRHARGLQALRVAGALLGIAGTALVVGRAFLPGYMLWFVANGCWIIVSLARRDWFATAMFLAYEAATVWGLVKA